MITQELIQFIQQSISQGKTKEEIRNILLSSGGWQESDIEEAFNSVENNRKEGTSFKWVIVLFVLAVLGVGGYFAVNEFNLLNTSSSNMELHTDEAGNFSGEASVTFEPSDEELDVFNAYIVHLTYSSAIVLDKVEIIPPSPENGPAAQIINSELTEESYNITSDTEFIFQTRSMNEETGQYNFGESVDSMVARTSIADDSRFWGESATVPFVVTVEKNTGNIVSMIEVYHPLSQTLTESSSSSHEGSQKILCGTSSVIPMPGPGSYDGNQTLQCLGENILNDCQSASAVFMQTGWPKYMVDSYKEAGVCMFKLATDDKSMQCPVSVARSLDLDASEQQNTIVTNSLDTSNPISFASELFNFNNSYVFLENEYDKGSINDLGCSGDLVAERVLQRQKAVSGGLRNSVTTPLSSSRAHAEIYFDQNDATYLDVCTYLYSQISDLQEISAQCSDLASGYAVFAPLPEGGFFCADNTGYAGDIESSINGISCNG